MLSLATKQADKLDLYTPIKKNLEQLGDPQFAAQLEIPLQTLQRSRDELLQIASFRSDSAALDRLAATAQAYLTIWNTVSQSFAFGKERVDSAGPSL